MDQDTDVSQVRSSNGSFGAVRTLTRIDPLKWSNDRLKWLYDQLLTQDYAFDDLALELGPQAFLGQVFDPQCEWYEIGDDGVAVLSGIIPKCNAIVHFAVWGDIDPREVYQMQRQLLGDAFKRLSLNRVTAYIPGFNKPAIRMATLSGFRYEGELRKAFLKHGTYHNLHVYGLLKTEFNKREEVRA